MAKKTLLTEGEFKKFMKLARLEPLAGEKLSEMYGSGRPGMRDDKPGMREPGMKDEEEDELDEELSALFKEEDEMPDMDGEEETAMEPVDDEPMGDDEMPDVELADDDAGGGDMGDLRGQIEDALENLLGLIDQGLDKADMGDVMDVEADDEGDEGMGGIEGGDAEMDAAPPAPEGGMDDEELMETVARRVARRLQRESKVDAKSDLIAERIMKRLKSL